MPVETSSATYDRQALAHLRITSLAVQGKPVALRSAEHGCLAAASFSGGALHLAPLAAVVALRPSLAHLDAADDARREAEKAASGGRRGGAAAAAAEEDEPDAGEEGAAARLTPLQVQVRRRETERQVEQRLASHAYLRAQQEEEPWAHLRPHGPDSPASLAALARLRATPPGRAGEPLSPALYVSALAPSRATRARQEPPPPRDMEAEKPSR